MLLMFGVQDVECTFNWAAGCVRGDEKSLYSVIINLLIAIFICEDCVEDEGDRQLQAKHARQYCLCILNVDYMGEGAGFLFSCFINSHLETLIIPKRFVGD